MKRTQRRVKTLTNVNRWIKKLGTRVVQLAGPAATPSALTNASARKDSAPLALLAQILTSVLNCRLARRPVPIYKDRTDAIATMVLKTSTEHAQTSTNVRMESAINCVPISQDLTSAIVTLDIN